MKCLLCGNYSFFHVCKNCQELFLAPSIYKRKILGIDIISFYKYEDIKNFLHTKHTDLGYHIYNILAKKSFLNFSKNFIYDKTIASICIDDKIKNGYSHTAILNKYLQSAYIKPYFTKLQATNDLTYSGKSKQFRLINPRNFKFKNFKQKEAIIVDDIITTGATLSEAINLLKLNGKDVLFCLTLADAKE